MSKKNWNLDQPCLQFLFLFSVVGRELMLALVGYLCEGYYSNLTIRELVDSNDLWVVPTMNPDGFAMSKEGGCCDIRGLSFIVKCFELLLLVAVNEKRG